MPLLTDRPALRDALRWGLPALLVAAIVRCILLWHLPLAYFGSDSYSYFALATDFFFDGHIDFPAKRRWLYPPFLLITYYLPGTPLGWIEVGQRLFGTLSILPVAYAIRKIFRAWRWLILPATLFFAVWPVALESEQFAHVTFLLLWFPAWVLAAWCAWLGPDPRDRNPRRARWWILFGTTVLFLLVKPVSRLVFPGLALAVLATGLWRKLRWWQLIPPLLTLPLLLTMGTDAQTLGHMVVTSFPALQMDSAVEPALKKEVADLAAEARQRLPDYFEYESGPVKLLVQGADEQTERPTWRAVASDQGALDAAYRRIARESYLSEPGTIATIAGQRVVLLLETWSKLEYLDPQIPDPRRLGHTFESYRKKEARFRTVKKVFGYPDAAPLETAEPLLQRMTGGQDASSVRAIGSFLHLLERNLPFARIAPADGKTFRWHLTGLGWLLVAGVGLAWLPAYRHRLGTWGLASVLYLGLVCSIISSIPPRQAAPIAVFMILLCLVPIDALIDLARKGWGAWKKREANSQSGASG